MDTQSGLNNLRIYRSNRVFWVSTIQLLKPGKGVDPIAYKYVKQKWRKFSHYGGATTMLLTEANATFDTLCPEDQHLVLEWLLL